MIAYAVSGGILHADEIFQYTEQAYRLVFGQGLIPWEYRYGLRSWLFPGALAGVMEAARLMGSGPAVQNTAIALFTSLLSLPSVACAYGWGRRAGGKAGAIAASLFVAAWSESLLMAVHPLIDSIAADVLVPAIYLLELAAQRGTRRTIAGAGVLLGLAFILRPQLAPAIFWCWLRRCATRPRSLALPVAAWGVLPVLLSGGLDWITLGSPFRSTIAYLLFNAAGGSSEFGVLRWYFYPGMLIKLCGLLTPVMALVAVIGALRLRLLAETAIIILLSLSLVPHKEVRFMFLAIPLLLTLAGVGVARLARHPRPRMAIAAGGTVLILCVFHLHSRETSGLWIRGVAAVSEMHSVAADPAACGLAVVAPDKPSPFYILGGYTHLRPGMVLSRVELSTPKDKVTGFDYLLAPGSDNITAWGLTKLECRRATLGLGPIQTVCLWHNADGCAGPRPPEMVLADPPFLTQAVMKSLTLSRRATKK